MASPDSAILLVLRHEGGYQPPDPSDPSSPSKFGISEKDYIAWAGLAEAKVENMVESEARLYYLAAWWDRGSYASLNEQALADRYFDLSVNMGTHQATKC